MQSYKSILTFLLENPKLGAVLTFALFTLILLILIYLIMSNFRLQMAIKRATVDKKRLMEEKDLIRKGLAYTKNTEKENEENHAGPNAGASSPQ